MTQYKATVTVKVWDDLECHPEDFGKQLLDLIMAVPERHRSDLVIELGDNGDYDHPIPQISLSYERHETAEEIVARKSSERAHYASIEAGELAQLARLQAKYGLDGREEMKRAAFEARGWKLPDAES